MKQPLTLQEYDSTSEPAGSEYITPYVHPDDCDHQSDPELFDPELPNALCTKCCPCLLCGFERYLIELRTKFLAEIEESQPCYDYDVTGHGDWAQIKVSMTYNVTAQQLGISELRLGSLGAAQIHRLALQKSLIPREAIVHDQHVVTDHR